MYGYIWYMYGNTINKILIELLFLRIILFFLNVSFKPSENNE